jgi:branched-chain amino acid transport system ATP-binding protein
MMELLKLDGVTVRFGAVAAIQDLSLSVGAGALVGVLGPNGAGKTTLLRAILNRVEREAGRLWFDGEDVTGLSTRDLVQAGIAMCPENRRLFPHMSIEDNLRLGAYGQRKKIVDGRLAETFDRFGWVAKRRRELAGRLSGGEQQTVAIARALMAKPKLLLLDEPSSGLSPVAINEVREVLAAIPESGTSMLLVEQNVTLVEGLCDEAWVLARGRVQDHGPVGELLAGVRVADVYLGAADIDEQIETTHQADVPQ